MDEEHGSYGAEIPDMDDEMLDSQLNKDEGASEDPAVKELEEMKKRLKEMEEEAAALRDMQAKVEKEMGAVQDPAGSAASQATKEEADTRSIYVGNVDYACTPEEVQQHFQSCGTVNRVTILTDKFGQPKGYAYVEFLEAEAVQNAILLNESELHGRQLKVTAKRTNVPGMKQFRGRRFSAPYMGYRPWRPPYPYSPYGYGKAPRFRTFSVNIGTKIRKISTLNNFHRFLHVEHADAFIWNPIFPKHKCKLAQIYSVLCFIWLAIFFLRAHSVFCFVLGFTKSLRRREGQVSSAHRKKKLWKRARRLQEVLVNWFDGFSIS